MGRPKGARNEADALPLCMGRKSPHSKARGATTPRHTPTHLQGQTLIKACLGLLLAVISIGALAGGSPAAGGTLRVGGSGAVSEVLRQLAPLLEAETGVVLQVVPSLGSTGANAAVADGALGLSVSGRDLTATETARGLRVAAIFRTPFGLATSRVEPQMLRRDEVALLYRSDKPLWPDGTPILIVLRTVNDTEDAFLGGLFPEWSRPSRAFTSAPTCHSPPRTANADMGEKTKGSLIGITLAQVIAEKRNLRFVAIDGVKSSLANLENGSYPYGRSLYVVVPSAVSADAEAFVTFLARPVAQSLLRKAGIVAGDT